MQRAICITQARMGSSRLPGKVLAAIQDKPMLEYHLARVGQAKLVDKHIIATSNTEIDKPIVEFCQLNKQPFFCGSELDVLSRFYHAALHENAAPEDIIIRLTGDCPLISAILIDEAITKHRQGDNSQYTHISLSYFPRGFDVEVFSMASLTKAYENATTVAEREHVTLYLYSQPDTIIVPVETGELGWNKFRLCVDEDEDLQLVTTLIKLLDKNWLNVSPKEICQLLQLHPEIARINANIIQRIAH
ncbi:cytidylyltransferase domain-containing protein [Shewanella morhuae]|uniref:3-deoxy-manno-octulosonate cytidylyltransferase n=1 Tax=Shewanella morhuae TaxID=365591 RepID=A0A380A9X8_9GAMM|nr:glycosyltransferase family protein [Shewanella morhuae]SUI75986.1 3-deoxy-manno-octulosonate cytidylyltransferase [Shewanella morhuae]